MYLGEEKTHRIVELEGTRQKEVCFVFFQINLTHDNEDCDSLYFKGFSIFGHTFEIAYGSIGDFLRLPVLYAAS